MSRLRVRGAGAALAAVLTAGCSGGDDGTVPTFVVDALWPMPLEYPSILGPVAGVTVAPEGNVLIVTRQDGFSAVNEINSVTGTGECCTPSQAVLEFAPDGRKVREWGGADQGYPWPVRPHGIAVDPEGNLWIGGGVAPPAPAGGRGGRGGRGAAAPAGPPPSPTYDTHILKFSRDGSHLMTIGQSGGTPSSASPDMFGGAAGFAFDADANEVFVADGYANHRVVVLEMTTGAFKRSWGAYGNEPSDSPHGPFDPNAPPAQQFRSVTCVELSNDDLLYVCDRGNNRIQVFETDGTFVSEVVISPATLGNGSASDVAFSADDDQRFLYVADGMNERVHIYHRETLAFRTSFGVGGRYPSHFRELGGVAVDAQGNLYTAENGQGRRVQKFTYLGTGPVTAEHQGALYPTATGGM
jgi:DNA-binding beta-propeller fold protein YncE